jgi:hypothetical protein
MGKQASVELVWRAEQFAKPPFLLLLFFAAQPKKSS